MNGSFCQYLETQTIKKQYILDWRRRIGMFIEPTFPNHNLILT